MLRGGALRLLVGCGSGWEVFSHTPDDFVQLLCSEHHNPERFYFLEKRMKPEGFNFSLK
jgi:hypothetical protein